jgi:uncharacterized protein YwgA
MSTEFFDQSRGNRQGQKSLERLTRSVQYAINSIDEMNQSSKKAEERLEDIQVEIMLEAWDVELVYKLALIAQDVLYSNQLILQNMTLAARCAYEALGEDLKF